MPHAALQVSRNSIDRHGRLPGRTVRDKPVLPADPASLSHRQTPTPPKRTHSKETAISGPSTPLPRSEDASPAARLPSYAFFEDGTLSTIRDGVIEPAEARVAHLHALFRASIESKHYVCTGAKSAFSRGTYRFAVYPDLGTEEATLQLHRDLVAYSSERRSMPGSFRSFIAVFGGPYVPDEESFEQALWSQLQQLHEIDVLTYDWDSTTSSDPDSADYSYSVAGTSFFVVGMHPASSRLGRKFICPTLVFNAHDQFEELREQGTFDRLSSSIRARDLALHGNVNPNLAIHGSASEARQYSGREIGVEWKCPFRPSPRRPSPEEGK